MSLIPVSPPHRLARLGARHPAGGARRPSVGVASLVGVALALAGCAWPVPPPTPPHAALIAPVGAGLGAEPSTALPAAAWWQALGDPALDALITRALADQPSLQAASARLARAAAGTEGVLAGQGLQAALGVDATRQRFSAHGLLPPAVAGGVRDIGTVQASGRIALDFFGRHEAALRAALGQQQAVAAELQAARVQVASQVAQGWVGLARLVALREVAAQVMAQRQALHALVAQRVAAGLDTQLELRVAEAPLPEAATQLAALDGQIALARHQLAVQSGQAPQALQAARPVLATLQAAEAPSRIGADLLARRADVAAARARVEVAAQGVAAARADFYPDINLAGFVGLNALGLDRLLQLPSRQMGIGPALHLPLFDGGLLRSQLQGRAAEADAAVAAYNAAVLDAAREVADASAALQSVARQRSEQARAASTADNALALARQRFEAGLGTRAPLLVAEGAVLAQRALAADLQGRQLDAQVALMRALGGGWQGDARVPPAPAIAGAPADPRR